MCLFISVYSIITATLIAIFQKEEPVDAPTSNLYQAYYLNIGFFKNKKVFYFISVKLFWRFGFMAVDGIYMIRLLMAGYPKEYLVGVSIFTIPVTFVIAGLLSKCSTSG